MSWNCGMCTFLNSNALTSCEICGTAKGAQAPAPQVPVQKKQDKPKAGLVADDALVPLQGVEVIASSKQSVAEVTLRQTYFNSEDKAIEAVYLFPIDDRAAICGFEAEIKGRKVIGEIQGKKEAKQTYDRAIARGDGAYLMEQKEENLFEIRVGNIPAKTQVIITIKYAAELSFEDKDLVFSLPSSSVAPGAKSVQLTGPPGGMNISKKFVLTLDLEATSNITAVKSSTHPDIDIDLDGNTGKVYLAQSELLQNDLKILISLLCIAEPIVLTEHTADGSSAIMLNFLPQLDKITTELNTEAIFVVDRSGSMSGSLMKRAARTLTNIIRDLPESVLFNVVSFGDKHKLLFPTSQPCTRANRIRALLHAQGMKADYGGTEVFEPLESVYKMPPIEKRSRNIFLLTDGEVDDPDKVIRLVRKHSGSARIFSFGIGRQASRALCRGVARASGGEAEFCNDSKELYKQVSRQVKRALAPAITDLNLYFSGFHAVRSPFTLRPIFHNEPYSVYGIVQGKPAEAQCKALIRGQVGGGQKVNIHLEIDFDQATSSSVVHTLAARESIRDLEEGTSMYHIPYPQCYRTILSQFCDSVTTELVLQYCKDSSENWPEYPNKQVVKQEIKSLGLTYSLASSETSFVAVEERDQKDKVQDAQTRDVPTTIKPKVEELPEREQITQTNDGSYEDDDDDNGRHTRFMDVSEEKTTSVRTKHKKNRVSKSRKRAESRSPGSRPQIALARNEMASQSIAPSGMMSPAMAPPPPLSSSSSSFSAVADARMIEADLYRGPDADFYVDSSMLRLESQNEDLSSSDESVFSNQPPPSSPPYQMEFSSGETLRKEEAMAYVDEDLKLWEQNGTVDRKCDSEFSVVVKTDAVTKTVNFVLPAGFPQKPPLVSFQDESKLALQVLDPSIWRTTYGIHTILLLIEEFLSDPASSALDWPPLDPQITQDIQDVVSDSDDDVIMPIAPFPPFPPIRHPRLGPRPVRRPRDIRAVHSC